MQPDSERRNELLTRLNEVHRSAPVVIRVTGMHEEIKALTKCDHEKSQIVRYTVAGGGSQARKQCLECGDVFGSAVRIASRLTNWDAGKLAYWIEKKRAGGICEGCREKRATQVHHLTYKHWSRELLFELVALCDDCHHLCHEERQSA